MCPVFDIPVRFLRCHIEFSTSARYLPRLRLPGLPRNTLPAIGGSTPEHPRCVVRVAGPHGGQTLDTTFRYAGASPSALAARPPAAPRRVDDCLDARAGCSATSRQLAAPGPGTTWNNILDLHPGPAGRRAGPDHATLPRRPDAAGIHPLPGHTDTITIIAGAGPPPAARRHGRTAAPPHRRAGVLACWRAVAGYRAHARERLSADQAHGTHHHDYRQATRSLRRVGIAPPCTAVLH